MENKPYTKTDMDIVSALRKNKEGLRYNALYKNLSKEPHRVSIKTFDEHLKKLVNEKIVERKEESRYNVSYRLLFGFEDMNRILGFDKDNYSEMLVGHGTAVEGYKLLIEEHISEIRKAYKSERKMDFDEKLSMIVEKIGRIVQLGILDSVFAFEYECGSSGQISDFLIDQTVNDLRDLAHKLIKGIKGEFVQKNESEIKKYFGTKIWDSYQMLRADALRRKEAKKA